jgi:hypothetical protein
MAREIPVRKAVTLAGLSRYREALKKRPDFKAAEAGGPSAPGLFPEASQMKFKLTQEQAPAPQPGPEAPPAFEPPDPFARG